MAKDIPQVSGWRATVKRLRRGSRTGLNRVLVRMTGTPQPKRAPLAPSTRRILVVRLNKRLGNILFLTPMLRALHAGLPQASIDVLIRDAGQVPLLQNLPGIGTVYVQPSSAGQFPVLARKLRRQHYDLAIDPSSNSIGNRAAVALVGARQRLGFARPDQWLRLTHAAGPGSSHQAVQGVVLLASGIEGVAFGSDTNLLVQPGEQARQQAGEYWSQAFAGADPERVIGFFTNATGRKRLDDGWWRRWLAVVQERQPQARLLQILPPGMEDGALATGMPTVCIRKLDVLAALLARLRVFVAADSGPMHLGAAAGTPVVGLFKATSAATYAPKGENCAALQGAALTPDNAAAETLARL